MGSNRCAWAPQTIGQRVAADPVVKRGSRQRVLQQTALCLIRKSSNRSCRLACSFSAYYPRAQFRGSVAQDTPSPPPPPSPPDEHLLPHLEILSKSLYFSLTSGTAFSRNRSPASGVLCMPPISWPKPSTSRQSALNTVMHRILYFRSVCMTLYLHT